MINLLLDILLFAFLARKRTPATLVILVSFVVAVVLIVSVIRQATYVR